MRDHYARQMTRDVLVRLDQPLWHNNVWLDRRENMRIDQPIMIRPTETVTSLYDLTEDFIAAHRCHRINL